MTPIGPYAECLLSLGEAAQAAGGTFHMENLTHMTVHELICSLSRNNIHFVYIPKEDK